jgi:hypothetical protein
MITPRQRQKEITDKIEAAQTALSEACQLACDLQGWSKQWTDIGKTYDAVNALWWRIHEAPPPGQPVPI